MLLISVVELSKGIFPQGDLDGMGYGALIIRVKLQRYKPLSLSMYTSVVEMQAFQVDRHA
jgi:hypothetical protein